MTAAVRVGMAAAGGLVFAWGAYRMRYLTRSGAVAAGSFAACLLAAGGLVWIVPGVVFFLSSSVLSYLGGARKKAAQALEEKGARRDAAQVLANGGAAFLAFLLYLVRPSDALLAAYLGAFAAAAADTWATEVGLLGDSRPRLITTFRPVERGVSGAISIGGSAAALGGALAVWAAAWPWLPEPLQTTAGCLLVVGAGFVAAFVDSLLGATVQRRPGGLSNDGVNLAATSLAAVLAWTCFRLAVFAS